MKEVVGVLVLIATPLCAVEDQLLRTLAAVQGTVLGALGIPIN
jgi:hypothetical protein